MAHTLTCSTHVPVGEAAAIGIWDDEGKSNQVRAEDHVPGHGVEVWDGDRSDDCHGCKTTGADPPGDGVLEEVTHPLLLLLIGLLDKHLEASLAMGGGGLIVVAALAVGEVREAGGLPESQSNGRFGTCSGGRKVGSPRIPPPRLSPHQVGG